MLLVLLAVFVAKMGRVEFIGIRVPEARLTMPGSSLHNTFLIWSVPPVRLINGRYPHYTSAIFNRLIRA